MSGVRRCAGSQGERQAWCQRVPSVPGAGTERAGSGGSPAVQGESRRPARHDDDPGWRRGVTPGPIVRGESGDRPGIVGTVRKGARKYEDPPHRRAGGQAPGRNRNAISLEAGGVAPARSHPEANGGACLLMLTQVYTRSRAVRRFLEIAWDFTLVGTKAKISARSGRFEREIGPYAPDPPRSCGWLMRFVRKMGFQICHSMSHA
jgi:hypothetical protein